MSSLTPTRVAFLATSLLLTAAGVHAAQIPDNVRRAVNSAVGDKNGAVTELLTSTAVPDGIELNATEVAPDHNTGTTRVRLSCVPASRCLPFYVMVNGTGLTAALTTRNPAVCKGPQTVRAGDRGVLTTNSSPLMRITLPVTALDAGYVGDIVRVRLNRQLVWRARILAPGSFTTLAEAR